MSTTILQPYPRNVEGDDVPSMLCVSSKSKTKVVQFIYNELIVVAGLGVCETEKTATGVLEKRMLKLYQDLIKKAAPTLPDGLTKDHFDNTFRANEPVTGKKMWTKWKGNKKLFNNVWNPIWKRLVPKQRPPSGWNLPALWLQFRKELWKSMQLEKREKSDKMYDDDDDAVAAMPLNWFPPEFIPFVKYGVASLNMDSTAAVQIGYKTGDTPEKSPRSDDQRSRGVRRWRDFRPRGSTRPSFSSLASASCISRRRRRKRSRRCASQLPEPTTGLPRAWNPVESPRDRREAETMTETAPSRTVIKWTRLLETSLDLPNVTSDLLRNSHVTAPHARNKFWFVYLFHH